MTPKARQRVRKTWNAGKHLTYAGILLALAHQAVDLRGKLEDREAKELATASAVAAVQRDVAKLAGRVERLEKAPKATRLARAAQDSLSSPGPIQVAGSILSAPLRLLGALGKAVFGG